MTYRTAVGLDVHARSIKASALDAETGEIKTMSFGYDPDSLAKWIRSFPSPVNCVYESGVTGNHLYRVLNDELGISCQIGAVSKMFRPPAEQGRKTDKRDSAFLARMLLAHNIVSVYVPDEYCEALRDLSRARDDCRIARNTCIQQLSQFLIRHGYIYNERTPKGRLKRAWGSGAYEKWLNSIIFTQEADQEVFIYYRNAASESDVKLKELDARIVYYSNHSRYKPVIDALCTLKGVSLLSAFALATEIDDFARFKNGVHLSSWLGLTTAPIFQWRKDSKRPYY